MKKTRPMFFASLFLLSALCATSTFGQVPATEGEHPQPNTRELGRPLAVTLSIEPGEEANGIVVYTATRLFQLTIGEGAGHMNLRLNGDLTTKENGQYLCEYDFTLDDAAQPDHPGTHVQTRGSVILRLGASTTIFKSKDLTASLTVKPAE